MAIVFRNYRFLMGAFALVMLFLLIRTSSSIPATSVGRKTTPNSSKPDVPQDLNNLPINNKPGYVSDSKTENNNPAVADAVKDAAKANNKPSKPKAGEVIGTGNTCTQIHQFVIMVDAGSTGSRIHIYEFDVCSKPPTLVEETFQMLEPGLSSFDTEAQGAALSLDPLLKKAVEVIPKHQRPCAPIAVKATAGLRLLGEEKANKILEAVRQHLEKDYPFPVVKGNGVSIMSGEEEGVYAWVTANFLLGNIGAAERRATSAVFDLGGGSTQIVFEPTFPTNEKMVDGEHKYSLDYGSDNYELYQFSHLGFGLMQSRDKINALLVKNAIKDGSITAGAKTTEHTIVSPCMPPGVESKAQKVKISDSESYNVKFVGPKGVAAPAQCRFLTDSILNKAAKCSVQPCSFNGVHQPSLVRTFHEDNDLYVFSYFYDRTHPLGMPLSFTMQELMDLTRNVCSGPEVWENAFVGIDGALSELKKDSHYCQDLSFLVSLLHTGYDIPLSRELKTAKTLAGNELGWCLGASLPLIDSKDWTCRVDQKS
ncbi:Guanosine-diphosphatase [Nakaseomyces bracarensis]|uniref:guanosine-diphosphatase n=1 Tax=Nakaseomyces bracarensis TaxID=273131 RepID=A0ABR4NLR1_9SACH